MTDDSTHAPDTAESVFEPSGINVVPVVSQFDVTQSQEETRSKIALNFTYLFLSLVVVCLVLPFIMNVIDPGIFADPIASAKELVTLLASVLAGPFGFIVGFYFKSSQDNNNNNNG